MSRVGISRGSTIENAISGMRGILSLIWIFFQKEVRERQSPSLLPPFIQIIVFAATPAEKFLDGIDFSSVEILDAEIIAGKSGKYLYSAFFTHIGE
jgi:hypothetical protein